MLNKNVQMSVINKKKKNDLWSLASPSVIISLKCFPTSFSVNCSNSCYMLLLHIDSFLNQAVLHDPSKHNLRYAHFESQ